MTNSEPFELHPRLDADTFAFADWGLCQVRLMNDCRYPWLVLVPKRNWIKEIHELSASDRATLMDEIATASAALENAFQPDKINVGALGNLVPQLHIHVLARWKSDPAWPGPVWGNGTPEPYAPGGSEPIATRLQSAISAKNTSP